MIVAEYKVSFDGKSKIMKNKTLAFELASRVVDKSSGVMISKIPDNVQYISIIKKNT